MVLLAILGRLVPDKSGVRVVPTVDELARGLADPDAPVDLRTQLAAQEYPIFRKMIDELCEAPIMQGDRATQIRELIRPFDDYYAVHKADPTLGSLVRYRTNAIGHGTRDRGVREDYEHHRESRSTPAGCRRRSPSPTSSTPGPS